MARIETVLPEGWPRPSGYANGMVARGRMLFVAGQIGWDEQQQIVSDEPLVQFRQALVNVVTVVRAARGETSDIVRLTVYLTNLDTYRQNLKAFGATYREIMGKHFPAMAFVGVAGLVEPRAQVEIEATAVLEES